MLTRWRLKAEDGMEGREEGRKEGRIIIRDNTIRYDTSFNINKKSILDCFSRQDRLHQ